MGMRPTPSGRPRLILGGTPLTTSTTKSSTTGGGSICPMAVVNEDGQNGVGGVPAKILEYLKPHDKSNRDI